MVPVTGDSINAQKPFQGECLLSLGYLEARAQSEEKTAINTMTLLALVESPQPAESAENRHGIQAHISYKFPCLQNSVRSIRRTGSSASSQVKCRVVTLGH